MIENDPQEYRGQKRLEQSGHGKLTCLKISTAVLLATIKLVEYALDKSLSLYWLCSSMKRCLFGEKVQNILRLQLHKQQYILETA